MNKIVLVSPGYNTIEVCEKNISTVLSQDYDNFDAVFIIDGSIDGTFEEFKNHMDLEFIETKVGVTGFCVDEYRAIYKRKTNVKNLIVWNRKERVTALPNWIDATLEFCKTDDILVSLDGDDWLLNKKVFSYINEMYEQNNIWVMYGGCVWTDGRKFTNGSSCCSLPYLEDDFNHLRKTAFKVSMMRTYKGGLFHKIKELDSELSSFKDSSGKFYESACDVALMYPILEMAGFERVKHNTKSIYVYNRENVINDDKVDQQKQWSVHSEILKKIPFNKISSL